VAVPPVPREPRPRLGRWILTPRLGDGSHGPLSSAEDAYVWWLQHRDALPPPQRVWRNGDPWEPQDPGEPL